MALPFKLDIPPNPHFLGWPAYCMLTLSDADLIRIREVAQVVRAHRLSCAQVNLQASACFDDDGFPVEIENAQLHVTLDSLYMSADLKNQGLEIRSDTRPISEALIQPVVMDDCFLANIGVKLQDNRYSARP
jgi:hypothetical protein